MGGFGSGKWIRQRKKAAVEDSLVLPIDQLRRSLNPGILGRLTWTWPSGASSTIGFTTKRIDNGSLLVLQYRWQQIEQIELPIWLQSTSTGFGGRRWWFTCPLSRGGVACRRRCGKLYLPPGGKYFGCRECHALTYRSCQDAHQLEGQGNRVDYLRRWLDTLKCRQR